MATGRNRTIQSLTDLTPDPRNANRGTQRGLGMVDHSLRQYGAGRSILVDRNGVVLAGNKTLDRATELGLDAEIIHTDGTKLAVVVRDDLDANDPRARELALLDNRSSEVGLEWDAEVLASLVEDTDLSGIFRDDELAELLASLNNPTGLTDPDAVPEPPTEPITKPGDLWLLGKHRLLCGDSGNPAHLATAIGEHQPTLLVTDPPYGVAYADLVESRVNQKQGGWDAIANDALSDDDLKSLLTIAFSAATPLVAFVWHPPGARRFVFWQALEANGWRMAQEIVWVKNALVFGRADYQWRHEPCIYAKRKGAPPQEDRTATTVWNVDKPTGSEHPTQKPVALYRTPIENHTKTDDWVFDPFLGSGTALIAAQELGRRCIGVEIEPKYVDVVVKRWEAFTGATAQRVTAQAEAVV